jgi:hypothetical protein
MENAETPRPSPVRRGAMTSGCRAWTPIALVAVVPETTAQALKDDAPAGSQPVAGAAVTLATSAAAKP